MLWLRPSNIYFSQRSISNVFVDNDGYATQIGRVVDDLYEKGIRKKDIPVISVTKIDGRWFTHDNRRLWVFKTLEALGKCHKIPVYIEDYLPDHKMTTRNGGTGIKIRGNPGGKWTRRAGGNHYNNFDFDEFEGMFRGMKL